MSQDQAYPLRWPSGWPRTTNPGKSAFAARTIPQALDELERELHRIGAVSIVVSSNVTLRGTPVDRGVCVYFRRKNRPYAFPCDKWAQVQDNIWAIAKHVEGLRASERWGVGSLDRVFEAFAALPPAGSSAGGSWWDVLQVPADCSFAVALTAYRALAAVRHPDRGGSNEAMAALNASWDQARAHFKQP